MAEDYGRSPAIGALPLMRQQVALDRADIEAMVRGGPDGEAARRRLFARKRAIFQLMGLEPTASPRKRRPEP